MAQAAWTRPTLNLSSWSCIGPRHRASAIRSNSKEEGESLECSTSKTETSEPLLVSPKKIATRTSMENIQLPVSASVGLEWTSEVESCTVELCPHTDEDGDLGDGEDLMSHHSHEDRMTEVELWQQLEHELYDRTDNEGGDVVKEIREEEAAVIAEVGEGQAESSAPDIKEAHRFFPPGKIMHIVTFHVDHVSESDTPSSSNSDCDETVTEPKVGIFLTSRTLYSKLRLSQTMISDHFMPVYRRQIEKLIKELDKEQGFDDPNQNEHTEEVVL